MASMTEELNFLFNLILINSNVNLYSHMFAAGYDIGQLKSRVLIPRETWFGRKTQQESH